MMRLHVYRERKRGLLEEVFDLRRKHRDKPIHDRRRLMCTRKEWKRFTIHKVQLKQTCYVRDIITSWKMLAQRKKRFASFCKKWVLRTRCSIIFKRKQLKKTRRQLGTKYGKIWLDKARSMIYMQNIYFLRQSFAIVLDCMSFLQADLIRDTIIRATDVCVKLMHLILEIPSRKLVIDYHKWFKIQEIRFAKMMLFTKKWVQTSRKSPDMLAITLILKKILSSIQVQYVNIGKLSEQYISKTLFKLRTGIGLKLRMPNGINTRFNLPRFLLSDDRDTIFTVINVWLTQGDRSCRLSTVLDYWFEITYI